MKGYKVFCNENYNIEGFRKCNVYGLIEFSI